MGDAAQRASMLEELEGALDYRFDDAELLDRALTHSSFVNECGPGSEARPLHDNERLEFLGDAVLQLTVSEWLFERFPDVSEGHLTQRRAVIVNADALVEVARELALGSLLRIGVGEERSGGRTRTSNLADAVEALLGAIFIEGGFTAAKSVVRRIFVSQIERVTSGPAKGPKSRLQEWSQAHHHLTPSYTLVDRVGPAHAAQFIAEVQIPNVVEARGEGTSKKDAEKAAARDALRQLELE